MAEEKKPANPSLVDWGLMGPAGGYFPAPATKITLRDFFAAAAMAGLQMHLVSSLIPARAYEMADAMLKERERREG